MQQQRGSGATATPTCTRRCCCSEAHAAGCDAQHAATQFSASNITACNMLQQDHSRLQRHLRVCCKCSVTCCNAARLQRRMTCSNAARQGCDAARLGASQHHMNSGADLIELALNTSAAEELPLTARAADRKRRCPRCSSRSGWRADIATETGAQ